MFVRIKKSNKTTTAAIQIVENQRFGTATKQRVIRHVGTAHTSDEIEQLKYIAATIKSQLEVETLSKQNDHTKSQFAKIVGCVKPLSKRLSVRMAEIKEITRVTLGIHDIYGYVYDHLGFTNLLTRPRQREQAAKILREIVLARIANPLSKRASVDLLAEKFGVSLDLNHVYQMMDKIDDAFCERIQQCALSETLKLTGGKLKVLFYDATTLYFESFIEDELKQNGYSKDMKFNQPQVLLCLFVTEQGLPVGYELFPGSTFEGHTLLPVLEKLKVRYQLEEVIIVADRGLLSEENLKFLEAQGFKYIVGARIKNVYKKLKELILDQNNYKPIEIKFNSKRKRKKKEEEQQKIAIFNYNEKRNLIIHYSSERARKDGHDRRDAIEKLYKKLAKSKNPKSLLSNYGYKKYIELNGQATVQINEEKIEQDARWDGLVGVMTNIKDVNPEQLLMYYHGLWQIEESFRINKHDLRMRPIFHWKPHRVKAHIAISFIAFVCVRYLEYLIRLQSQKLSPEVIRKSLLQVQASIIEDADSGKRFLLSSTLSEEAKEIYRVVGIKVPTCTTQIHCGA